VESGPGPELGERSPLARVPQPDEPLTVERRLDLRALEWYEKGAVLPYIERRGPTVGVASEAGRRERRLAHRQLVEERKRSTRTPELEPSGGDEAMTRLRRLGDAKRVQPCR